MEASTPQALSVVVPLFNEENNLDVLYQRLSQALRSMTPNYEIILVNDGSTDGTMSKILELSGRDEAVKYLELSRNFGQQIALTAGLERARGEAVVIMDGDLQDPPELIPSMYQKLKEGYEVVYAKRRSRKKEGWIKRTTARFFYRLLKRITSFEVPLDTGDFRMMNRSVLEILNAMPEQNKFIRGQVAWIGFSQAAVEYDREGRQKGSSSYSYSKMIGLAINAITSFSTFPLKIASLSGFVVSGLAFFTMLYAIFGKLFTDKAVPGWASLMVSVLFLGGIQLITIGIIGEYISRIGIDVRKRPLYVVKKTNLPQG